MTERPSPSVLDRILRLGAGMAKRLLMVARLVRRPGAFGAHALAFTAERRAVLVRLRYAPGWRLPGGGRHEQEDPRDAVLRELREEIGMTAHGVVRESGIPELLIVEDVRYRPPRWSWEVEAIAEFKLDALPADLSTVAAGWIDALRDKL